MFGLVVQFGEMGILMVVLLLMYVRMLMMDLLGEWLMAKGWKGGI